MIKDEVLNGHLASHRHEMDVLKRFEGDFDVTWANRITKFNTEVSVYFLKPHEHMVQSFGFEQEILLAVSSYPVPEARLIQAVEQVFQHLPARGRVDQTVVLIVSEAPNISAWLLDYISRNPQGRAYVGISAAELKSNSAAWLVRNVLVDQLFSRDLFDYTLPLDEDLFFFGRQAIVAEHIDAIRKSENRGIFGLRKTGKTSVLFKVQRICVAADIPVLYYDCKFSPIYRMSCDELIDQICLDLNQATGEKSKGWKGKKSASDRFLHLVKGLPDDVRFCIIFDEIEYISAGSLTAPHWQQDFVPFWQTIWSVQSQFRRYSFVIAGVNASVVETEKLGKIQNPMFGIVKSRYLTGFERAELFSLLSVFGKRMGLNFEESAVKRLHQRYGGHPLLTRMICSHINNEIKTGKMTRPVKVSEAMIEKDLFNREQEIQFYCGHITSELEEFYRDEYELLELLASGNVHDFNDLAQDIDLIRHLKSYGLVNFDTPFVPTFAIPVIQGYISAKWRKKSGIKSDKYIVPESRRMEYVSGRINSIVRDLRIAERKFEGANLPALYRLMGPSEAELLVQSKPAATRDDASAFLNQASRSLIEPLDRTGESLGKKKYFFSDLEGGYLYVWKALNRVRAYRNYLMHGQLNPTAQATLDAFLMEDFEGKHPDAVDDGWFRLQQAILDGLLIGVQAELARFN